MSRADQAPQGAHSSAEGLFEDRRPFRTQTGLENLGPLARFYDFTSDTQHVQSTYTHRLGAANPLVIGLVLHAIPYLNWYKVQLGEAGTYFPCTTVTNSSSMLPLGVRCTGLIPPNSIVAVWLPRGQTYGYILGVVPNELAHFDIPAAIGGWVQQGGNTGLKREVAHMRPTDGLFREGGTRDWSSGRPLDQTCFDWGMAAETGVALHVDPFQAYLRASESAGLFLNFWDSYCKLVGQQLEIQSYPYHLHAQEDEGENQQVELGCIYPWESLGNYQPETNWTKENGDQPVHYSLAEGKIDVDSPSRQPIARYQEYGGYPGQGRWRLMMVPEGNGTTQAGTGRGVWNEHIALDGAYSMRSAKSVYISKRSEVPLPQRLVRAEDQREGQADDKRQDNYRFSGWPSWAPGTVELHSVIEPLVIGDPRHYLRVAGVKELFAYNYYWKACNGFYYHQYDWNNPCEGSGPCGRNQEVVSYGELMTQEFMTYPSPSSLKVDHRYNNVNYFPREAYIALHEDGSVCIGDGYGSMISMSAGQIRLEPASDCMMLPGRRFVVLCWDSITRASNSVDISATSHDVRIKAEKIVQILAGNGGQDGGVLIESKATKDINMYQGLYGEQVKSSGVVLLAKKSKIGLLGKEIYLRTGGGELKDGRITLDASKGSKELVFKGKRADFFLQKDFNIWQGMQGESGNATKNHRFGLNFSCISGNLVVEKNVAIVDGGLAVKKWGLFGKALWARSLAHRPSFFVGKVDLTSSVEDVISRAKAGKEAHRAMGSPAHEGEVKAPWYTGMQLGAESLLRAIGFSFRDPPGPGIQYKTIRFQMPEPNWLRWINLGQASGGVAWTEKPVIYQGAQTYPWPGKTKYFEPTLLGFNPTGMNAWGTGNASSGPNKYVSQANGHPKDLNSPSPKPIGSWSPRSLAGYKLVLPPN